MCVHNPVFVYKTKIMKRIHITNVIHRYCMIIIWYILKNWAMTNTCYFNTILTFPISTNNIWLMYNPASMLSPTSELDDIAAVDTSQQVWPMFSCSPQVLAEFARSARCVSFPVFRVSGVTVISLQTCCHHPYRGSLVWIFHRSQSGLMAKPTSQLDPQIRS